MRFLNAAATDRAPSHPPRRRPWRPWRGGPSARLILVLAAILIMGGGLALAGRQAWFEVAIQASRDLALAWSADRGLIVARIEIEGRARTERADVIAALAIEGRPPLYGIDLAAMRQRLLDLPWVAEAEIERRLPDLLAIRLTELVPFALWQHRQRLTLIARDGQVIEAASIERHRDLPIVVGERAPPRAALILDLVATNPDLAARVRALVLVGERRWNLRLDNGIDVKLPEIEPDAAWRLLAALVATERILDKDISIIDLRFEGRVVLRLAHPPGAGTAIEGDAEPGKET